jgi:transposase, IS6 family
LLAERGLQADHTTIWRWAQRYGPELKQRLRRQLKPTNKSWRVDETYIRVKGRWCYLYRAIDSTGATIDFLLSALRDAAAAKRLFRQALGDPSHPQPRVINTDRASLYSSAIAGVKAEGTLRHRCRHRPVRYLNNILEQDHRAIKGRVKAKQSFREFYAAGRTIAGYEAIHMIRQGQARWVSDDDVRQQNQFIDRMFDLAARDLAANPGLVRLRFSKLQHFPSTIKSSVKLTACSASAFVMPSLLDRLSMGSAFVMSFGRFRAARR